MPGLDVINDLSIASPCSASWAAMEGDDRARFCGLCAKHVYNIAALTTPEVDDLIRRTEGQFCARLYRRRDGTVLTADCPVGAKAFGARRLHRLMTLAVLGAGLLVAATFARDGSRGFTPPAPPPSGPGFTFADWTDWALRTLGLRASGRPGLIMGELPAIPAPPRAILGKPVMAMPIDGPQS
jgi:hypothetical protein